MADKVKPVEGAEAPASVFSYLSTAIAVIVGLVIARRLIFGSKKKKTYRSGLHREVALPSMRALKQHVTRTADGGSLVRPSEGASSPDDDLIDYSKYNPPHTGTAADYAGPERKSKKGIASLAPRTVMSLFEKCVKRCGDRLALKSCDGKTWTWAQYNEEICTAAKSLIAFGFAEHDCINILGFNSPEWLILNCAAIFAGGMAAGVYTTNNTEACEYIAEHSKAKLIAVENLAQLEKYVPVASKLPCKVYVVWQRDVSLDAFKSKFPSGVKLLTYTEFLNLSKQDDKLNATLKARIAGAKATTPCTLIYTSGTTGNPKAVAITHDNCTWTAATTWANLAGDDDLADEEGGVRLVSYLPLSHIAAQMLDVHAPIFFTAFMENSCSVHFADANALKGTLLKSLLAIRPTHFFGVPRVWEKFQAAMMEKGKANGWVTKQISAWARAKGLELLAIRQEASFRPGKKHPAMWFLAKKILQKVRLAIGMDRCRICLTGAAPINKSTLEFFFSLDIPVLELYGMSECTGPTTISHLRSAGGFRIGACGAPLPGTELKIDHVKGRDKTGEGEILFRGRHIMAGYLFDQKKTDEAIDKNGWLHSGDVGRVDDNGLVSITGRIKELLIGSGGENVAPVPVETRILDSCKQGLANFVMIGDKRKFFVGLATPRCVQNPDGSYSQALDSEALKVDPSCTTATQASKSAKWRAYVQAAIDDYNKNHAVSQACKIVKFEILPNDFSVPTEELGPTLKLKRNVVNEKYASVIDSMYPKDD